jgi:predicted lactoylglutathione lyase
MHRMIFVNLPVADLEASRAFYTGLGFEVNEMFSDDTAVSVVVSDTIVVMLLTRDRFGDFVTGPVGDPKAATTSITCISAESPQEVDDLVRRALASGGGEWLPKMADGPMYGHSFSDPDGHVWEVLHMDLGAIDTSAMPGPGAV